MRISDWSSDVCSSDLSLSYFRRCLDEIVPQFDYFAEWMEEIKSTILRDNRQLMDKCKFVNDGLNEVLSSVTGRFESFDRNSQTFWENISDRKSTRLNSSH